MIFLDKRTALCAIIIFFFAYSKLLADSTSIANIAVNPFTYDGISEVSANTLTDAFRSHLLKTRKFQVMERTNMKQILEEQDFIESDKCDATSCGVKIGKLLGVEKIVMGNIGKVKNVYSVTVRLVSVERGSIEADESQTIKGDESLLLTVVIPSLAKKLAGLEVDDPKKASRWLMWGGTGIAIFGAGALGYSALQPKDKPLATQSKEKGSVEVTW